MSFATIALAPGPALSASTVSASSSASCDCRLLAPDADDVREERERRGRQRLAESAAAAEEPRYRTVAAVSKPPTVLEPGLDEQLVERDCLRSATAGERVRRPSREDDDVTCGERDPLVGGVVEERRAFEDDVELRDTVVAHAKRPRRAELRQAEDRAADAERPQRIRDGVGRGSDDAGHLNARTSIAAAET